MVLPEVISRLKFKSENEKSLFRYVNSEKFSIWIWIQIIIKLKSIAFYFKIYSFK